LMSLPAENILDSRTFWSKFYLQNLTFYFIILVRMK